MRIKSQPKCINTVDLFCGAGGATTGLETALIRNGMKHRGIAIDHWKIAVDTMRANHPLVETKCMGIEESVPADLVPSGVVDLLWASPSCTHHSRAKGGKPRSNQLRSQPELLLTWLDQLFVRRIIIENVPEFVEWGPLAKDGKPIKSEVGNCFRAFIAEIESRNYIVDWRIVNCADYGDATTRRRFFLKAVRRGCGKIVWPKPEFEKNPIPDLFEQKKPWRRIRECLDLTDTGKSIFGRKKPLCEKTMSRIMIGLKRYCGIDIKPFIVTIHANNSTRSIDKPIRTLTCVNSHYLCKPLLLSHQKNGKAVQTEAPIGALTTHDNFSIVTPVVIDNSNGGTFVGSMNPINAITTKDNHMAAFPVIEDGRMIDIRIRMLKPEELAAAHSFPSDYKLTGTKTEQFKQIGNSVPVMTAAAMCEVDILNDC